MDDELRAQVNEDYDAIKAHVHPPELMEAATKKAVDTYNTVESEDLT